MRQYISARNLTLIAVLFHLVGLVGIGMAHNAAIADTAPWHLLLMFVLLLAGFGTYYKNFIKWLPFAVVAGFAAEWVGVHTGWLFGSYSYGRALGLKWQQVPLIICCNWAIVLAGAASLASLATNNKYAAPMVAATIATGYDWVLEPAALRLEYWQWQGAIPLYNYACWWVLALLLSILWQFFRVRTNQFAINLLLVQVVFFALLRTMI